MARHIGIVGVSPEGAALFYREVSRHAARVFPAGEQPRISLHNEPLALYIDAIKQDDWHSVGRLLRRSAEILARCGAEFCMTPDNVVQHAIQLAEVGSPIPWLAMTELVARAVSADKRKTVGVIGTKLVTRSSTYQTALGMRGVHLITPSDDDVEALDTIIYGELIFGVCAEPSRATVTRMIDDLKRRGGEGVILGCSEAPLAVTSESSCLPLYDPTDILAEATVRQALVAKGLGAR